MKRISNSAEETEKIGREIGQELSADATLCLSGDLGAGKTTLIKGIVSEVVGISPHEVTSPTFTYLNIYEGKETVYHFDCYRLQDEKAFLERGLGDYFEGLCLLEWPEKVKGILPKERISIHISYLGEGKREIICEKNPL
ncbi:tRNA (adenosine(37)-N6)-threonylcarbamoyltransferase complex ATPase subunit type 1 TsaE [Candidatus Neptunochlamydia vexilliferae]|uniref:tRNA (adenosine(37)-N6)-threonylcarbamoyltransferase complex ATPase subunit type 1 TsaE n=1 Tax=Candidatus Neptunichlamydia vexilliferae TaxID=1651774 RepID=UPI001E3D0CB5|nr:tRNA (adenosine(37)-N6)-threonylcarbamoyltransferase complex ATPase subunit type 1 TsaE [Candidatus Neptunochlamydia vexilliferae]